MFGDDRAFWGYILIAVISFLIAAFGHWIIFLDSIVHELGHLCVAKICGCKVWRLSIGGGKEIFRRQIGKMLLIINQPDRTQDKLKTGGYVYHAIPHSNLQRSFIALAGPASSLLFITIYLTVLKIYGLIPEILTHSMLLIAFWTVLIIFAIPSFFVVSSISNLLISPLEDDRKNDGLTVAVYLVIWWEDRFKKPPPFWMVATLEYLVPLAPLTLWGAIMITIFWFG